MSDNPYNLKTKAGQRLWQHFNNVYGSSIWGPLGRGIEEIEAEVRQGIMQELEDLFNYYAFSPLREGVDEENRPTWHEGIRHAIAHLRQDQYEREQSLKEEF